MIISIRIRHGVALTSEAFSTYSNYLNQYFSFRKFPLNLSNPACPQQLYHFDFEFRLSHHQKFFLQLKLFQLLMFVDNLQSVRTSVGNRSDFRNFPFTILEPVLRSIIIIIVAIRHGVALTSRIFILIFLIPRLNVYYQHCKASP